MTAKRTDRLNSLLREVIADVIRKEVKNPHLPELVTITSVEITKDLRHAKVYVSVIGTEEQKQAAIEALTSASGFIGARATKQVVMRHFPELRFLLDDSVDKQMRIDAVINEIQHEREAREDEEGHGA